MTVSEPLNVAVVFGGRSVEHDVSIITGLQACEVLSARHRPVPVYIDRHGAWFSGERLRSLDAYRGEDISELAVTLDPGRGVLTPVSRKQGGLRGLSSRSAPPELKPDVVLAATHGTQGEDGCLQGLLELTDLPYVGPTLEAAVLAMNKAVAKTLLRSAGLPVLDDLRLGREAYESDGAPDMVARVRSTFGLPVYVKPVSLGSSVGVSRCATDDEVAEAIELAFELDRLVLVEPAVEGGVEINCAVIGRPGVSPRSSACEQPVATEGFLSFDDKYMRGEKGDGLKSEGMSSAARIIPAPISDEQAATIRDLAERTFTALGCAGVARVDMLVDGHGHIFVNECNTIPGSFAFYLWEPVGLEFVDLMDELISLALGEHAEKSRTTRTFETNLLSARAGGAKT